MNENIEKKEIAALRRYLQKKINETLFSGLSLETDSDYIDGLYQKYPNNPSALIAKGYLEWRFRDKADGIALFEKAFKIAKETDYVLQGREIGVNTFLGTTFSEENVANSRLELDIIHVRQAIAKPVTILAACDEGYFQRFARSFLSTCLKHSTAAVHIHVINPSESTKLFFEHQKSNRVSFSFEQTAHTQRSYYASSRFLVASSIFDKYNSDLLILDIDSVVVRNLDKVLKLVAHEAQDVFVTTMKNAWNPWNYHLATTVYLKNIPRIKDFLTYFVNYYIQADHRLGHYENAWWIDQNALYAAIKFLEKNSGTVGNIRQHGLITYGPMSISKNDFSELFQLYDHNINMAGKVKLDNEDEFLNVLKRLLKHKGLATMFLDAYY